MAEAPGPTSFENLNYSGLFKAQSKDNKEVSLQIDTWQGNTSIVIFAGGKPWKMAFPEKSRFNVAAVLRKMSQEPQAQRQPIKLNAFVEENGKKQFKEMGQIGFALDENLNLWIDVAHSELSGGRHTFPIKGDARYDFKETSLTERDNLNAIFEWFIHILKVKAGQAEMNSSFKRQNNGGGGNRGGGSYGGGGGNRGGYSGGGNSGGGNNYGNNNNNNNNGGGQQRQSNTFGGGADSDNDLHV